MRTRFYESTEAYASVSRGVSTRIRILPISWQLSSYLTSFNFCRTNTFQICFRFVLTGRTSWEDFGKHLMSSEYILATISWHMLAICCHKAGVSKFLEFSHFWAHFHKDIKKSSSDRFQSSQKASLSVAWVTEIIVDTLKVWIGSVEVNMDPRTRWKLSWNRQNPDTVGYASGYTCGYACVRLCRLVKTGLHWLLCFRFTL